MFPFAGGKVGGTYCVQSIRKSYLQSLDLFLTVLTEQVLPTISPEGWHTQFPKGFLNNKWTKSPEHGNVIYIIHLHNLEELKQFLHKLWSSSTIYNCVPVFCKAVRSWGCMLPNDWQYILNWKGCEKERPWLCSWALSRRIMRELRKITQNLRIECSGEISKRAPPE